MWYRIGCTMLVWCCTSRRVFGFKPTYGLLDTTGTFLLSPSFDTAGFLAKSIRDIAMTMQAIGFENISPDPDEFGSLRFLTLADNPITGGAGLVDATRQWIAEQLDAPEIAHPKLGTRPVDFIKLYNVVRASEALLIHEHFVASESENYQPSTLARLKKGAHISDSYVVQALSKIPVTNEQYANVFAETDILLSSTVPIEAPRLNEPGAGAEALMSQCTIWNILGWPALSIPYWVSDELLPKSIQVIGKPGKDADVLRAGKRIQQLLATQASPLSF